MNFAILGSRGFPSTYSGYETLVRHLAPFLVEAGHEATVYTREPRGNSRIWTIDGVRCIATPGLNSKSLSTPSHGFTSSVDAAFRNFDAILVVNIANGFWLPLLRLARTPAAVNTDGIEWERGKWNRVAKAVFRFGAKLSSRHSSELICDSIAIGEIWRDLFGRESTFIPYGAPVLEDVPSDRLIDLGLHDRPYLLSVARLVPENNVDLTLDALEDLEDLDLIGVIVGSSVGPSPVEDRLERLSAAGRVIWLGHVSDQELLTQLWANSTIYVHGHSVGGTNPSLLQAMGAGAPVLALDTPFNAEVLNNPLQLYSRNSVSLAEKMTLLLEHPSLSRDLRKHAQRQILDRYSWDKVCGQYLTVLEQLGDSARPNMAVTVAQHTS